MMQTKTYSHLFSYYSFSLLLLLLLTILSHPTTSDPQTEFITKRCSSFNTRDLSIFIKNRDSAFSQLQSLLSSNHFATAQSEQNPSPVYALAQCRNYLSTSDCLSCFSLAASQMRNCSPSNSGRIIYDGCFLRYQAYKFYDEASMLDNSGFCRNRTVLLNNQTGFNETVTELLSDLCEATPEIDGYFAAARRGGVFGVAQCALTTSRLGCGECLKVAYGNVLRCPIGGAADGSGVDEGCFLRYSDAAFFSDNQTMDLSRFLRKKVAGSSRTKNIGGVVGGAVSILFVVLLLFLLYRHLRKAKNSRQEILGATELRGPVNFPYDDLKSATRNFSDENKLGGGGFGDVYKGVMRDGKTVAVKKLMISQSDRVKKDFEIEVKLINNVHHRNLVRLLGCCNKGPELLLVYEFMANNSLDKHLFGEGRGTLNWKQRSDIIIGTARGLAYLHEEFHICIIHRDIKTNNILLDDELQPKIADFGLARLLPADRSHLSTKFAGTLGYMAPEYAIRGKLSEKVDVYSYGVVVLEIISGRKSSELRTGPVTEYLITWAWRLYEEGSLMELVDESLDPNEYDRDEVKKVMEIALMCTQSVASRPTMSNVVVLLLGSGELGLTLTRPSFINNTNMVQNRLVAHGELPIARESSASNATLSISQLSAR